MSAFPSTVLVTEFFALITGDTPHLALYTSNPGPTNTGAEVSGGSYARQPITFGSIVSNAIENDSILTFNAMPTAVITHWGILDASTSGNLLAYGPLSSAITTTTGDNVTIDEGQIDLTFAGS